MLSRNFDDSATIMARIRLARRALTKLQEAIFGSRDEARCTLDRRSRRHRLYLPRKGSTSCSLLQRIPT
jgi:hypothetical protein